jgi:hypothetical protein
MLRNWWNTDTYNIVMLQPDAVSPIPDGIPLFEAEKIVRERELGVDQPQKSVIEPNEAFFRSKLGGLIGLLIGH